MVKIDSQQERNQMSNRCYQGLILTGEQSDSPTEAPNFFEMIARGELFRLYPIIDFKMGSEEGPEIDDGAELQVRILSVRAHPRSTDLVIEFRTYEVPEGLRQGIYALTFSRELVCSALPDDMFVEG